MMTTSTIDPSVATEAHTLYAFDVVRAHFARAQPPPPAFDCTFECPLFVTWTKRGQLRGCIGTLKPLPLSSIHDYALNSALRDRRFDPMASHEVQELSCAVQLLSRFELAASPTDWEVGVHGVTIAFADGPVSRSAVYLPDVMPEQGWDQMQAINSLVRKSGCARSTADVLRDSPISVTRFISTKHTMSYARWVELRGLAGVGGGAVDKIAQKLSERAVTVNNRRSHCLPL